MPVIDVQVHPFDRNHPGRPWASPSHGLDSATGEEMVAAMTRVGVDGAIMVSSFSAYEYDYSYALEVYNKYPDKFRVVTPVDATDPAIDDVVAKWAATKGARGIRIRMREGLPMDADHPGLNRAFAAAGKHGLPVNLLCWCILDKGLPHIQRHPDTVIVIDHLGLLQPARPPVPPDVWADLPKLLALAQYPNVRVKISGACTMSHQPFPYDDIWEPVLRVIDAFGLERCMWTRQQIARPRDHTQAVELIFAVDVAVKFTERVRIFWHGAAHDQAVAQVTQYGLLLGKHNLSCGAKVRGSARAGQSPLLAKPSCG